MLALAVLVLGVAFFLTEHDWGRSRLEAFSLSAEQLEDATGGGSAWRQLAFSLVAAMGLFFLLRRGGRRCRFDDPLAWLLILYVAWCATSVAWSIDALLTAKRVVVLAFCLLGALGLARQLSPRQLCLLTTAILTAYCVLGLGAEMALGTFRPWSREYRFGGTVHPNTQGVYCAALCLAAAALAGRWGRQSLPALGLFAVAAVLLVLTRSRTACVGLAFALAVVALVGFSPKARLVTAVAGTWVFCTAVFATALCGMDPQKQMTNVILLGRTEHVASLNGRIPLWNELLPYVRQRPLQGYGYDGFWNAHHIEDLSEISQWAIHVAHSMYLDVLLSVGLIGAGLLLLAGALGAYRHARQYLIAGDSSSGFFFGLLVFGAVTGVLESGFIQPMFVPMVAACGLAQAAFGREEVAS